MLKNSFLFIAGSILCAAFFGCTRGGDESMMVFECEKQNSGEACNKLGMKKEGEEALRYFRLGCEKQSSVACISLAERTPDKAEASRVLKLACDWKNTAACDKMQMDAAPASK